MLHFPYTLSSKTTILLIPLSSNRRSYHNTQRSTLWVTDTHNQHTGCCCTRGGGWAFNRWEAWTKMGRAHWFHVRLLFRGISLLLLLSWSDEHSSFLARWALCFSQCYYARMDPSLRNISQKTLEIQMVDPSALSLHHTDSRRWAEHIFVLHISLVMK